MQILNISVMNRPAKSITSRPYPTDVLDSIYMTVGVSARQDNYNLSEDSNFSVGIMDCMTRELLVALKPDKEAFGYSAGVMHVQITKGVAYIPLKADTEGSKYSAGLGDVQVTRFVKYISIEVDTEASQYSAGLLGVQVTK